MRRLLATGWERVFGDSLRSIDAQALAFLNSREGRGPDRRTIAVLLTAAVCLTLVEYLGGAASVHGLLDGVHRLGWLGGSPLSGVGQLLELGYWSAVRVAAYVLVPAVVIRVFLKGRLRDHGAGVRGSFTSVGVYLAMLGVALLGVLAAATSPSFQAKYPFYHLAPGEPLWPGFLVWQGMYAVQFLALEFFFRGFLVHGTKHRFGVYSVFVAAVPYCMIHFGKPLPETLAALVAGVALGLMSLKTGAIWMGVLLHIAVAWSMDWVALWQRGAF